MLIKLEPVRRFTTQVLWIGRQVIFWGVFALAVTFVGCSAKLAIEGPPSWTKYQSMCERMQQSDVALYSDDPTGHRECLRDFPNELETRSFFMIVGFFIGSTILTIYLLVFWFRRRKTAHGR